MVDSRESKRLKSRNAKKCTPTARRPKTKPGKSASPEIAALFAKYALEAAAAGLRRYSARDIFGRIRWFGAVEKKAGDRYKVNNNLSAQLARDFMTRHPELGAFFATRERSHHDA